MQKNIIFCCFCNFKILNKNAMQNVYILRGDNAHIANFFEFFGFLF